MCATTCDPEGGDTAVMRLYHSQLFHPTFLKHLRCVWYPCHTLPVDKDLEAAHVFRPRDGDRERNEQYHTWYEKIIECVTQKMVVVVRKGSLRTPFFFTFFYEIIPTGVSTLDIPAVRRVIVIIFCCEVLCMPTFGVLVWVVMRCVFSVDKFIFNQKFNNCSSRPADFWCLFKKQIRDNTIQRQNKGKFFSTKKWNDHRSKGSVGTTWRAHVYVCTPKARQKERLGQFRRGSDEENMCFLFTIHLQYIAFFLLCSVSVNPPVPWPTPAPPSLFLFLVATFIAAFDYVDSMWIT